MDSLTQAVLGAALQGSLLGRVQGRKALLYGAALGTLPDLDVLLDFGDAVGQMTYHRGFSHSLFLISAFSLLLTALLRWRWPNPGYSAGRLFSCIWLVLVTHVLIDACTTYGTQMFWPLAVEPTNFSNIFVIDPLYTLPLLVAVLVALWLGLGRVGRGWLNAGLLLSSLYMASTFINQALMRAQVEAEMAAQGFSYQQLLVMPTPFNTLAWRILAIDGDSYLEGVRSWLDEKPLQVARYSLGHDLREVVQAMPQQQRLQWFNGGWMSYSEEQGELLAADLRLGMFGVHAFRFALAKRDEHGQWQPQTWVEQRSMGRGTPRQQQLLLQRIMGDQGDFSELFPEPEQARH